MPPMPTRGKYGKELPEEALRMILSRIGYYESNSQIISFMKDTFNLAIPEKLIDHYRNSKIYESMIESYRDKYESEIIKVELASKRRRLEELQAMYFRLRDAGEDKEARATLAQLRIEREGNASTENVYQFNQFNHVSDSQLLSKLEDNSKLLTQLEKRNKIIEIHEGIVNSDKEDENG